MFQFEFEDKIYIILDFILGVVHVRPPSGAVIGVSMKTGVLISLANVMVTKSMV